MSLNEVYITRVAKFLPNNPVSNEEMEEYLGLINGKASKSKRIVLRNNGIKRRFYAVTKSGEITHTNADMTALALKGLFGKHTSISDLQLLSCGTSTPDQLIPSHGLMVHGCLPESNAIEVVSPSGVCCSGMHAFKYAYMAVKSGEVQLAASTGSERVSPLLRAANYESEIEKLALLDENPYISFDKDFLRWMLSDGAGAFLLADKPNSEGLSLRVEWIESTSYAHQVETCMYMGAVKNEDGTLKSYMAFTPEEVLAQSVMSIKQDVKLLSQYIIDLGFQTLKGISEKRRFDLDTLDYFIPHMSSEFFIGKFEEKLKENGMEIPHEKWFTNLSSVGNVGAASIYLMMEELFNSGKLVKGQKLMMAVPESARFSYVFALLTVC